LLDMRFLQITHDIIRAGSGFSLFAISLIKVATNFLGLVSLSAFICTSHYFLMLPSGFWTLVKSY
jgi:hypothetical protein